MSQIQDRLRAACEAVRRNSMPLSNLIPLMQHAADRLDQLEAKSPVGAPGELLPCPFCGSEAHAYPDGDTEGYSIMCSGKGALFEADAQHCPTRTFGYESHEASVKAWNTRAVSAKGRAE